MKTINILGPIWDFVAEGIIANIDATPKDEPIEYMIHSPGGSIYAGYAIFSAIQQRANPEDVAVIAGTAFSAATWIALAPENLAVYPYSEFFVHRAMMVGCFGGNVDFWQDFAKTEVRKIIRDLNVLDKQLAGIYAARLGKSTTEVMNMLSSEHKYVGKEMVDNGIATELRKIARRKPAKAGGTEAKNLRGLPVWNLNEYDFAACSSWHDEEAPAVTAQNFPVDDAFRVATRKQLGVDLSPDDGETDDATEVNAAQVTTLTTELEAVRAENAKLQSRVAHLRKVAQSLIP